MGPSVLFVGGTGEISLACIEQGLSRGWRITVLNRGGTAHMLPAGVEHVIGDMGSEKPYERLEGRSFASVNQFRIFDTDALSRDIDYWSGKTDQYIFISTASAYQKPPADCIITEQTPLANPFWDYSQKKADCETLVMQAHAAGRLPVTIVRPSHTYRTRMPLPLGDQLNVIDRIMRGQPIIVPGDGTSIWTATHASDFAAAYVHVVGNSQTLGEAYHITHHRGWMWRDLIRIAARTLDAPQPTIVGVPTARLITANDAWRGPLLGDKTWSVIFDNTKIKSIANDWSAQIDPPQGTRLALPAVRNKMKNYQPDEQLQALFDQLAKRFG